MLCRGRRAKSDGGRATKGGCAPPQRRADKLRFVRRRRDKLSKLSRRSAVLSRKSQWASELRNRTHAVIKKQRVLAVSPSRRNGLDVRGDDPTHLSVLPSCLPSFTGRRCLTYRARCDAGQSSLAGRAPALSLSALDPRPICPISRRRNVGDLLRGSPSKFALDTARTRG